MQSRMKLEPVIEQSRAGHKPTVREATFQLLRTFGMTTVFGNPGSTELRMFRDWPSDFRYVLGLQESVVVAMADGYAQVTRRPALVNLHSAGGVGHALGSVFTAYRNQTPLVIMAGQQTRAMLPTEPFLSARSAVEFPRPYVKWSIEPARGEDVPAAIAQATYTALQRPCGPVFVSVPEDDWDVQAEPVEPRQVNVQFAPDPGALDRLADALNSSRHPALVVGAAVDQDGAWPLAIQLAERLNASVWESPMSGRRSFPEDHPLFAGFLPPLRQPLADRLAGHDVVLVIGAPVFTYHVHTGGALSPRARSCSISPTIRSRPPAHPWGPVSCARFSSGSSNSSRRLRTCSAQPRGSGNGHRRRRRAILSAASSRCTLSPPPCRRMP